MSPDGRRPLTLEVLDLTEGMRVRRFSDSILFAALFLIDVVAMVLVILFHGVETGRPDWIAPLSIGGIVIIAAPALFIAMLVALGRSLTHTPPRHFYMWATLSSVISAIVIAIADIPTEALGIQVGFSWMVWFFGILALACVIALIISFTGGIPDEDAADKTMHDRDAHASANGHQQRHRGEASPSPSTRGSREDSTTNPPDATTSEQSHATQKQEEDPFQ